MRRARSSSGHKRAFGGGTAQRYVDERDGDVGIGMSARHVRAVSYDRTRRVQHNVGRLQCAVQEPIIARQELQICRESFAFLFIKVGLLQRVA